MRKSPALEIMDITAHKEGQVSYHDPRIASVRTNHGLQYKSIELSAENLNTADVVVLTTNHDAFDVEFVQQHAKLIVDMRNIVKEASEKEYNL